MKTDLEIIEIVRRGDRLAFSELVKRHQRGVLRMALRFLKDFHRAEDVVQESFLKAYQKLHLFEGRSSFKSWLYQIVVNTAKNKIREEHRDTINIENVQISVKSTTEGDLDQLTIKDQLKEAVDRLPMKQKTALILRVFEDLSFKEIAEIMSCPYDTAKANYRHGLMRLKKMMLKQQVLKDFQCDFEMQPYELVGYAYGEAEQ